MLKHRFASYIEWEARAATRTGSISRSCGRERERKSEREKERGRGRDTEMASGRRHTAHTRETEAKWGARGKVFSFLFSPRERQHHQKRPMGHPGAEEHQRGAGADQQVTTERHVTHARFVYARFVYSRGTNRLPLACCAAWQCWKTTSSFISSLPKNTSSSHAIIYEYKSESRANEKLKVKKHTSENRRNKRFLYENAV